MQRVFVTISRNPEKKFQPQKLAISPGCVEGCPTEQNIKLYLGYCTKEEYEERVKPIREAMEQYNSIVFKLWETPGFQDLLEANDGILSREQLTDAFGQQKADLALSLKRPPFCFPELKVRNECLTVDSDGYYQAALEIESNTTRLLLGADAVFPNEINKKICLWNWANNETDFAVDFLNYLDAHKEFGITDEPAAFNDLVCYNDWRGTKHPAVTLMNCIFTDMEKRGYLERYELFAKNRQDLWSRYTETDNGSVGLCLIDKKAFRDRLLMSRIKALFAACSVNNDDEGNESSGVLVNEESTPYPDFSHAFYYLQDGNDKTYIARDPGKLGGHYKLKIYGRLDCPSANRYLAKGQYIRHRVFFKDESTAISAGYRPCAICMPEAYKAWKKATVFKP